MKEIKITERAHKEIRKLFSQRNVVNTLKNDPELTEIFDNFTFDQALRITEGPVLEKTRVMCILAATIGRSAITEFRMYVDACLNVGVKPREIREIVYQSVPYVGFAKVLDFLLVMNDVFDNNDIKLPLDNQSTTTPENRLEKGRECQEAIFGKENIAAMIANTPEGQEHLQEFLSSYAYGDFYTRNGIDLQHRELITFCFLASMSGCEKQMKRHVVGCNKTGINKTEMVAAVTAMLPYIGFPRSLNAIDAINEIYK